MSRKHESGRRAHPGSPERRRNGVAHDEFKNVEKVGYTEDLMDDYLNRGPGTPEEEQHISNVIAICSLYRYTIGYNQMESFYKRRAAAGTIIYDPKLEYTKKEDIITPYMEREIYDVSLIEIIRGREDIARKEPIKVFGHILHRSTELYAQSNDVTSRWVRANKHLNFIFGNLGSFDAESLKKVAQDEPRLTPEMIKMAGNLYKTFERSYRETLRVFSDPNHPKFPELEDLYTQIKSSGNSDQLSNFINQMTNLENTTITRAVYHFMQNYHDSGNEECPLYTEFQGIIEESYEGMTGDEFSEFHIPRQEVTEDIGQIESELHQLKNKITKKFGKKFSRMNLDAPELSDKDVRVSIEAFASKNDTLFTFRLETPNGDNEVRSVRLMLFKGGSTTWDFLKTNHQLPDEYYTMASYARSLLRDVVESFQPSKPSSGGKKKEKIHVRDEVYDLRKQRSEPEASEPTKTEQVLVPFEQRPTIQTDSAFYADLIAEHPEQAEIVEKALSRYHGGYRNLVKMGASDSKRNLFRLREGNYRIIIEQDKTSGIFQVVDVGDRKAIYRKYK